MRHAWYHNHIELLNCYHDLALTGFGFQVRIIAHSQFALALDGGLGGKVVSSM